VLEDGGPSAAHTWTYDHLDRLITADLPGSGPPLTFDHYTNDDLKHIVHGNGATTDYTYFPEGPIERITVKNSGGSPLLDLQYQLDATLNIDAILEAHEPGTGPYIYDYEYDGLDRLIGAQYPTALGLPPSESFAYDPAGNREDPSDPDAYAYDANNRITASPAKAYTFDEDGSVSRITGSSRVEGFTFDKKNRLRAWTDGTSSASYLYDPFGRRVRKLVNGIETWFVWDGGHLVAEYESSGVRTSRYSYGGGFAPIEIGTSTQFGESVYEVHSDHLDSPRMLSGVSSALDWRLSYLAFGQSVSLVDLGVTFMPRLPGQHEDTELGLHYNRFRYYDPSAGRYISGDPLGQLGEANLYPYARNLPTVVIDPLGLVDLNFFAVDDEFHAAGEKIPSKDDEISVVGHGFTDTMEDRSGSRLDPERLAELIKELEKYRPGMPVRLYSCYTGQDPEGFAKKLADALGRNDVEAPDDYIHLFEDGTTVIAPLRVADDPDSGVHPTKRGKFNRFSPTPAPPAPKPPRIGAP